MVTCDYLDKVLLYAPLDPYFRHQGKGNLKAFTSAIKNSISVVFALPWRVLGIRPIYCSLRPIT